MNRIYECLTKIESVRHELITGTVGGILIREQPNFSYITAGGRGFLGLANTRACAMILITGENTYLLTNSIEASRLLEEELPKGVFTPVVAPWPEDGGLEGRAEELTGGGIVTDDQSGCFFPDVRTRLCPEEQNRFRALCADAAQGLESTFRDIHPGITEFEVAGHISAALWERGMEPISLFIAADERSLSVRHCVPTAKGANRQLIASICARRGGLVASVTRSVSFGRPDAAFRAAYDRLLKVEAYLLEALAPGVRLGDVFAAICAAYTANGLDGEWMNHHQGGLTGYAAREIRIDNSTQRTVRACEAYAFNPSCPGAKVEDTLLLTDKGIEIMTACGRWPTVEIAGRLRPDVLII